MIDETRIVDDEGVKLIQRHEKCVLTAYRGPDGIWTIGWGHTGPEVVEGLVWTQDKADEEFWEDIMDAEDTVDSLVTVGLSDNQFAALVSFVFNIGDGAFKTSTLLKKLNTRDYVSVPAELARWNHCKGKVLSELMRRRADEAALWSTPDLASA